MASSWLPWSVMVFGMFLVWGLVYSRTESIRRATMVALIVGKSFTVVYKLAGLDRTVLTLYLVNRYGYVREIRITMVMVLLLAFLASLLAALYWPVVSRYLPREVREALEAEQ
ncbi:hypothetical protein [Pyrofollis japonicus]|uniref:hypothetical protein n=1 Tax=Pyrofollis japonicus TaxID=3060460 RepID=UPI00295AC42A|nr:hypothetical protein [Pyrofollis japonicus]